ncbi:MAG TPA: hypothetical protein VF940_11915, partial [Streptosporangiaceae bacterium]
AAGWPEMWTRSGNLIVVLHGPRSRSFGYAVYSPSGTRLATLATGLTVSLADQRVDDLGTGIFWYLTAGGDLVRTDGAATAVIANTRALGLTGIPEVWILRGGLVQLLSVSANWRQGQVILYPDGQLFARIPAPQGQVAGFGELSASPGRRLIAYILTTEPGNSPTVFVVRPGGAPVAVYRTAHGARPALFPRWPGTDRGCCTPLMEAAWCSSTPRAATGLSASRPPSRAATGIRSGFSPTPGGSQLTAGLPTLTCAGPVGSTRSAHCCSGATPGPALRRHLPRHPPALWVGLSAQIGLSRIAKLQVRGP